MAKAEKKSPKEASELFHNIIKASVSGNPKSKKMPHEILFEVSNNIKKLNKKYPAGFVRDGLEVQVRTGFVYTGKGRELFYNYNPNLPPTIVEDIIKTITKTAKQYPDIIAGIEQD